jgi:hypothetical protein
MWYLLFLPCTPEIAQNFLNLRIFLPKFLSSVIHFVSVLMLSIFSKIGNCTENRYLLNWKCSRNFQKIISDNPTKLKRKNPSPANEASVEIWARKNKHQVEKINYFRFNTKLQNRQFLNDKKCISGWSSIRKNFFIVENCRFCNFALNLKQFIFLHAVCFIELKLPDAPLAGLGFCKHLKLQ